MFKIFPTAVSLFRFLHWSSVTDISQEKTSPISLIVLNYQHAITCRIFFNCFYLWRNQHPNNKSLYHIQEKLQLFKKKTTCNLMQLFHGSCCEVLSFDHSETVCLFLMFGNPSVYTLCYRGLESIFPESPCCQYRYATLDLPVTFIYKRFQAVKNPPQWYWLKCKVSLQLLCPWLTSLFRDWKIHGGSLVVEACEMLYLVPDAFLALFPVFHKVSRH